MTPHGSRLTALTLKLRLGIMHRFRHPKTSPSSLPYLRVLRAIPLLYLNFVGFPNLRGVSRDGLPTCRSQRLMAPSSKYHRRPACVPDSCTKAKIERRILPAERFVRFLALIPRHRRDAYDTFRSAAAPRRSPARLFNLPVSPAADPRAPAGQSSACRRDSR
jgi:hypothetical protein